MRDLDGKVERTGTEQLRRQRYGLIANGDHRGVERVVPLSCAENRLPRLMVTTGSATGPAVALAIDCASAQICRGAAPGEPATVCVPGTFSAFSFAYEPTAGAPQNVCTRD